jgi:imidazolonepropionase-like amidohydrolase
MRRAERLGAYYLEYEAIVRWVTHVSHTDFRAATINNAREFKMESQLGSSEPGKIANLVLMKKSPLESVDAYDSITTVWVHGQAIVRDRLAVDADK